MENVPLRLVPLCRLSYWGAGDDYHTNNYSVTESLCSAGSRRKTTKETQQQRGEKESGVEGKVRNRKWNEQTEGMGNREKGKSKAGQRFRNISITEIVVNRQQRPRTLETLTVFSLKGNSFPLLNSALHRNNVRDTQSKHLMFFLCWLTFITSEIIFRSLRVMNCL